MLVTYSRRDGARERLHLFSLMYIVHAFKQFAHGELGS